MRRAHDEHVTHVDRSPATGTLVVCTCGLVLGPLSDHERALGIAKEHRGQHRKQTRAPRGSPI